MIYTAGPDLNGNEEKYVVDALRQWQKGKHNLYLEKFENKLSECVNAKYVHATNSGTGALHLACMALGLRAGDEVITTELSWIASANVIEYVGARPVFCDVAEDTWCIDENKIEGLITENTKAILVVYLYGNMPDMNKIMDIAAKYHIKVIADACPALGAAQKIGEDWKMAGSIADIECFSFQGAKMVTSGGEGGAICTNDQDLFERAMFYNDNCMIPGRKFWHCGVGHCYDMNNISAAVGLAQLERADEFVKRKRQIFGWYYDRLQPIKMNEERSGTRCTYWMSSIVLDKVDRKVFMEKLKDSDIDSRPIFYPISSFPHYVKASNKVADYIGNYGVNLPSGLMLSEDQVDYISSEVNRIYESLRVAD